MFTSLQIIVRKYIHEYNWMSVIVRLYLLPMVKKLYLVTEQQVVPGMLEDCPH